MFTADRTAFGDNVDTPSLTQAKGGSDGGRSRGVGSRGVFPVSVEPLLMARRKVSSDRCLEVAGSTRSRSLREVAQELGVSHDTVGQALKLELNRA